MFNPIGIIPSSAQHINKPVISRVIYRLEPYFLIDNIGLLKFFI